MTKVIKMTLDTASISGALIELHEYQEWIKSKASELVERLANMGVANVSLGYARAAYTGSKDIDVSVENRGDNKFAIVASGETVLVLEFGAGIKYGNSPRHPQADKFGYGPGTHPDKHYSRNSKGEMVANWENDLGWWTPSGEHTYGNPPSATMYETAKGLREELVRVAREVFSN